MPSCAQPLPAHRGPCSSHGDQGCSSGVPPHLTCRPSSLPQATKQFLEEINKWTGQYNVSPLSWNVAVKFLMARKFDVLRAIELFHSYRVSEQGRVPPSEGLSAL